MHDAYLVPVELILCIVEKIVLSPLWCDFVRDKMSIKEGVTCSCDSKLAMKIALWSRAKMSFEKHLRSVSRAASERLGVLRISWRVFNDTLLLERCFCFFTVLS